MTLQCELSNDRERGPGHALLRLSGGGLPTGSLGYTLMRNQGTAPFLGQGGQWQATEYWHEAELFPGVEDAAILRWGPDLVDPLVVLPTTVALRLTLRADGTRQAATLKVLRPLLGSGAAAAPIAAAPEPPPAPEPISVAPAEPTVELAVAPIETSEPPNPPATSLWPWLLAGVVLLALASGGLYAYLQCLIPGFGSARCAAPPPQVVETAPPPQVAETPPAPPPATPQPTPPGNTPVAKTCTGLTADACLALADGALADKKKERARQLYQEATRLGAVAANVRLARMYDPEGWSAGQSPVGKPDWETAAYWYEEAARGGDQGGRQGAGRLLCRFGASEFERGRGLQLLREAAQQGADVQALIDACGGKP